MFQFDRFDRHLKAVHPELYLVYLALEGTDEPAIEANLLRNGDAPIVT